MGKVESPPILVLGGLDNALAIVRSFWKKNIPVSVSAGAQCPAFRSRFCNRRDVIPPGQTAIAHWENLLLGPDDTGFRGSVIFPCSDEGVAFLADHRQELERMYILDDFDPDVHRSMLDKQRTLELARSAGCPAPRFWEVNTLEDLEPARHAAAFPAIVKPIHSHLFQQVLGEKLFVVNSDKELVEKATIAMGHGLRIMVCELIPGLDSDVQSSYYTYIDRSGNALFRFTKRVIRRYPSFGGTACLHITQWLPETAEMGERFFRGIGFRGMGMIEFKRDPRDGLLKIIECNPRFSMAHELLVRCGMDSAYIIYCSLTNRPLPRVGSYEENLGLWYPVRDLKALIRMRQKGEITVAQWLRSVARRQVFPLFSLNDPQPSIGQALDNIREWL
jgi:predicted ATP-grasp superfamily ATP-dependent carboligase